MKKMQQHGEKPTSRTPLGHEDSALGTFRFRMTSVLDYGDAPGWNVEGIPVAPCHRAEGDAPLLRRSESRSLYLQHVQKVKYR